MNLPDTITTLIYVILFFTPGLIFEQGIERHLPFWRTNFKDRFVRFSMWSFIWTPILSPFLFFLWKPYNQIQVQNKQLPFWIILVGALTYLVAYIIVPFYLGKKLGQSANKEQTNKLVEWILGIDLAPRAWDMYFRSRTTPAWIRARFKNSGEWVAGGWTYASSYPETEDIALDLIKCDPKTGEIASETIDGISQAIPLDWKMIIKREDIDLIAWQATENESSENG